MTVNEKLRYIIEIVGGKRAVTELNALDRSTQNVGKSSAMVAGKLTKVGQQLGLSNSKAMGLANTLGGGGVALAATAAGTAVLGFGKKAVDAFQSTALEAGKMADATGLSVEAASRWREVAGDMGANVGALEGAIGKMNKTLGASPATFERFGVAVARAQDGTVDVNATFLNVIDRLNAIPDASKRAAAAAALLGRGWQEVAEVIGTGSAELRDQLGAVSEAKVIDPAELAKAKKFRETMDEVSDSLDDVALSAGEALVELGPLIKVMAEIAKYGSMATAALIPHDAAAGLMDLARSIEDARNAHDVGTLALGNYANETQIATAATKRQDQALADVTTRGEIWGLTLGQTSGYTQDAIRAMASYEQTISMATQAIRDQQRELDLLNGELDVADMAAGFEESFANIFQALEDGDTKAVQQGLRNLKRDVLNYSDALGDIPEEERTAIVALIDEGELLAAEQRLAILTRNRTIAIGLELNGGVGVGVSGMIGAKDGSGQFEKKASGGPVAPGGTYLVGERGPELLQMGSTGGNVVPNSKIGGTTINVTVNAGLGTDGYMVGRQIREWLADYDRVAG